MPTPRLPKRALPILALAGGLLSIALGSTAALLISITQHTPIDVAAAPRAHEKLCTTVTQNWPHDISGHPRIPTTSDPQGSAAWGKPAIIARCGITSPGPTTDECIDVNGVDWIIRHLDDGMQFISYGRSPAVEVLVPKKYAPEPLVLSAFAPSVQKIPQTKGKCL
ncbi:DUF3515 family protein [Dermatophilus congolensis]|uniref:DUF3515 family protein n=1 Tax=Dermatophilus congolensis TaxID=1863 RepID=UPI001AAF6697|nr:DUF3515 family protein [Dermatophilus congolensis]MBO3128803.1 DUF3515 family protein [Dermatophilus congolensis]MBO3132561.1 DUF3515 family protein [Dermatophilus congolensis]MBO3133280.1 DUF3515 family protein [Dermatophilus congolensis]MBO3135514.1 DUF3515 family protein [Dermatophilus congolensis]MBO3137752.1 DUF3515 family protein [Dermatophilus congolensis]